MLLDLRASEDGEAVIRFASLAPCSPTAYWIGREIRRAALEVEGVRKVRVICEGHVMDELVDQLVNRE